jgi:hypothetical protein
MKVWEAASGLDLSSHLAVQGQHEHPSLAALAASLGALAAPGSPLDAATLRALAAAAAAAAAPAPPPRRSAPAAAPAAAPDARRDAAKVRRTVYVSDLEPGVDEAALGAFFEAACGGVEAARLCGDAAAQLRFGFVQFSDEAGARVALRLHGALLGGAALRVAPSRTAIVPVAPALLPRSAPERAAAARTVYVSNLDRAVGREALRALFEALCGPVARLRLLGDARHATQIAFCEFEADAGAAAALACSGALVGALPVRVERSKTPVWPAPRRPGGGRRASPPPPPLGECRDAGSDASSPTATLGAFDFAPFRLGAALDLGALF